MGSFIPTILAELAVHEWDIRSTLASPGEPLPSVSGDSIPAIMEKIPGNRGRPWPIPFPEMTNFPGPVRYRFELTGVGATDADVVFEDKKGRMETAGEAAANVNIGCDTSTFVLLMYGRLTLGSAVAAGRLTAEGDLDLISVFDRWLEGD